MVEAAIAIPIIIIASMLLIRLFVFYIEILVSGVNAHEEALEKADAFENRLVSRYEDEIKIDFLRGGLLLKDVSKTIRVEKHMINEDAVVRANEILEE